ncbi:hypothetical protein [Amycolatopsis pittospori]|uniref:hypothetical protein n=1 Tax=Amycolatopsis pittospori TaxID=2749434 RepID=UPI0015F0BEE0|nr:hypothetical protein [Amycolatopsis pittospori]
MGSRITFAAVAALALAGLASGTSAASAQPTSTGGIVTIQADCQWLSIKRTPPAVAIANCNSLDPGFTQYRAVVECADGNRHLGNLAPKQRISTARCPANTHMTSNGPWIVQV